MAHEVIEICLAQKHFNIVLDPLVEEARAEVKALFAQEVDMITLLKAYITKTQEYAKICQSLENLCKNIENAQEPNTYHQQNIDIQSVETPRS